MMTFAHIDNHTLFFNVTTQEGRWMSYRVHVEKKLLLLWEGGRVDVGCGWLESPSLGRPLTFAHLALTARPTPGTRAETHKTWTVSGGNFLR